MDHSASLTQLPSHQLDQAQQGRHLLSLVRRVIQLHNNLALWFVMETISGPMCQPVKVLNLKMLNQTSTVACDFLTLSFLTLTYLIMLISLHTCVLNVTRISISECFAILWCMYLMPFQLTPAMDHSTLRTQPPFPQQYPAQLGQNFLFPAKRAIQQRLKLVLWFVMATMSGPIHQSVKVVNVKMQLMQRIFIVDF